MRPEFWQDETVASWPEAMRLFYVGLWGVCDDAGYFEYIPKRIAALVYPYDAVKRREGRVAGWLLTLVEIGKVRRFEGCDHAVVPTLPEHQKSGGNPSFTVKKDHDGEIRTSPESPVSNVRERKGMERGGTGGSASDAQEARGRLQLVDGKWVAAS